MHLLSLVVIPLLIAVSTVEAGLDLSEFGPQVQELFTMLHTMCMSKSGTDEESIDNVKNGKFTDEPKIKTYMTCLLTECGAIDEGGSWNLEAAAGLLPEKVRDKAMASTRACNKKLKGIKNVEDRIFNFFKCIYETSPDVFIFI